MGTGISVSARSLLMGAAALLIFKVTLSVILGFRDYLPPNFDADFLLGREAYFWGPYCWAFYTHLASGPVSLLLGTILISGRFRGRFPRWHRRLGRVQVACVLLLVAPSGLWMAGHAMTGAVAGVGLGTLALATAVCTFVGWRAAVARRFDEHRNWMWRMYVLLCSAVVIRIIGGLATVLQLDALWIYPLSAWVSWLVPLAIFECWRFGAERFAAPPLVRGYSGLSPASIDTSARRIAWEVSSSKNKTEPSARTA